MDIETLKQEYISLGGNETDIEDINSTEEMESLCTVQKEIYDSLIIRQKEKESLYTIKSSNSELLQKWVDLQQIDESQLTMDEKRKIENSKLKIKNDIFSEITQEIDTGMQLVDEDLRLVISIKAQDDLLSLFEKKTWEYDNVKTRLRDLAMDMEDDMAYVDRRETYLSDHESKLEFLKGNVPDMYVIDDGGHTRLSEQYTIWRKATLELKKLIESKVKGQWSAFRGGGEKPDERQKEFVQYKEICSLLSEFGRGGDGAEYAPAKNYFSHEKVGVLTNE